jgi:hypothetical protein
VQLNQTRGAAQKFAGHLREERNVFNATSHVAVAAIALQ